MDVSSLASLKAELARKKNEAALREKAQGPKEPKQGSKTDLIWRKNKEKDKPSSASPSLKIPQEEEMRIQAALEMKAKLYDKIKSGRVEDKLGIYLVNFKKEDDLDEGHEENVYLDPLSEAVRHENIRKKWEEAERENLNKTDIHYQDVLFDEARDHGTAFYRFSKDAEERTKELSELRRLREETERERVEKDAIKKDRHEAMKRRLKKIKDKKRQKLGLPPVESDDEEPIKEEPKISVEDKILEELKLIREKQADEERKKNVKEWDVGKTESMFNEKPIERRIYSQEEWVATKRAERPAEFAPFYQQQSSRSGFSRRSTKFEDDEEWDNQVNYPLPKKRKKKKKKKKNRQQQLHFNQNFVHEPDVESASSSSSESSPEIDLSEVPLPPEPPSMPQKVDDEEKESFVQEPDFSSFSSYHSSTAYAAYNTTSWTDGSSEVYHPSIHNSYSNFSSIPDPKTFKPIPKTNTKFNVKLLCNDNGDYTDKAIINELEVVNLPTPNIEVSDKRTGVEIPPPCNMEYFSSTNNVNKRSHWQGSRSLKELSESFQAGLTQRKKMAFAARESEDSEEEVN